MVHFMGSDVKRDDFYPRGEAVAKVLKNTGTSDDNFINVVSC